MDNNYFVRMGRSLNNQEQGTKEEEWNPFAAMFICQKNKKSTMSTNRTFFFFFLIFSALGYTILSVEEALKDQSWGIWMSE